jgi:2-oxoglutarate dehydrogenase E1 component
MSLLTNAYNLTYLDELYAQYLKDPSAVSDHWKAYFGQFGDNGACGNVASSAGLTRPRAISELTAYAPEDGAEPRTTATGRTTLMDGLRRMIDAYRTAGHWLAQVDPLHLRENRRVELDPGYYGFTPKDFELLLPCEELQFSTPVSLHEILARLKNTYCGSVGVEFMQIRDDSIKRWLRERMEQAENRPRLSREQKIRILSRLIRAVAFDEFIRKKFIGAKSFSIEGAESLIPLLDGVIEQAAGRGIDEIVFAMAHRGRLNVLANIIGKKPREIFREFADRPGAAWEGSGDVKYHLGHSNDYETHSGRKIHLSLCFNPSHLEFVNPVALGRIRAKQDRVNDHQRTRGMALLIHGDAGFAGEGIVQETLNLSQLEGYTVGGTVHVIVNNQLGFTTAPHEGRSSAYATDAARMLDIPIFHVNGDDPEAIAWVVELAMEFRSAFHRDAVIDMYCYRRWGHNEGDEPSFTQPVIYQAVKKQPAVRELYLQDLLKQGCVAASEADEISVKVRNSLDRELEAARGPGADNGDGTVPFRGVWAGYRGGPEGEADDPVTGFAQQRIADLLNAQTRLPADFHLHPKIERAIAARRKMARGKQPLDWSAAEALAFASLVTEGIRVRLSGQDSRRGTFSQRHAVLYDHQDGRAYIPLEHLSPDQAPFEILNSPLSEAGVLGFEYGYSLDCPDGIVLWEAQFGDFANAAQVFIDQFIAAAEQKWRRLSGLIMLLPHGFEGMGPEHSSARLERFLQLGARDNIQVVYPTSPAQYFHCLRRQALRKWRKPLLILTPKGLLRHSQVVSTLADFSHGRFQPVMPDNEVEPKRVKRVLLCSGKVVYELDRARKELRREDVAIVRLEQLYPLPHQALENAVEAYARETPVFWIQEEPENMGAWSYLNLRYKGQLFDQHSLTVVCRPAAASPATGWSSVHKDQQAQLLARALGEAPYGERSTPGAGKERAASFQEVPDVR